MDIKEVECECQDLIQLAEDKAKCFNSLEHGNVPSSSVKD